MEREQLDRLLAQYATGGLTEEERKTLFAAALTDQDLFDQLMEEDALRETIELPGARNRLIDSLQEELVEAETMAAAGAMMQMPVPAAPAAAPEPVLSRVPQPKRQAPQPSMWLAWAAGIGIVFVSGAVTYMLFDRPVSEQVAQVTSSAPKDVKPFVPPPSAVPSQKPKETIVEEPPKIMAENRAPLPQVANVPLPSAAPPPPPPAPVVAEAAQDARSADKVVASRSERDLAQSDFRGQSQQTQQTQSSQQQTQQAPAAAPPPAPVRSPRPAALPSLSRPMSVPASAGGAAAGRAVAREEKAKEAVPPLSAWRRSGDGVWIRVQEGESVGRHDTIGIRYTPRGTGRVALVDDRGQRIAQKEGHAGDELELIVPAQALVRATGEVLGLNVTESPAELGILGRVARKDAPAPTVRIILRLH